MAWALSRIEKVIKNLRVKLRERKLLPIRFFFLDWD